MLCKPEDSMAWYEKLWRNSVELFRSLDIPVRQLECCSGDLADLKVKSCDIEAWSPRQQKYFEVCSCSNLGDAQSRRLKIRIKGEDGKNYLPHTLNNTCVAPPRMLIAFLEIICVLTAACAFPRCCVPTWVGRQNCRKHNWKIMENIPGFSKCEPGIFGFPCFFTCKRLRQRIILFASGNTGKAERGKSRNTAGISVKNA